MESWGYVSQEKGFICDEINSPTNSLIRDKCSLLAWESTINNVEFPEMIGKELPDSISDVLRSKKVVTTYGISFDPILSYHPGEDESTSKLSCSVVDSSNGQDSLSLINLKLGQFGDHHKDPQILSSESSTPPKKVRSLGVYSKMAFCQVYGCNKDLSSSKDYHKRHKVCEVHSKTAKVMVKGIEQRFCQQCSRFHLLAEFDDGKRSCRKRLAGHNERRRKPHVIHSRRTGRLLHSSNGGIFQGTTSSKSSFICQDLLPSAIWNDDCYRHIKVEDNNNNYKHLYEIPITNGTKPLTFPYNMESQFSPFHYNGVSSASTENMFHHFNASSNFQVLHAIPDSIRALSLLSSQSQNSSNHSMACQYNNMAQVPEQKLMEEVVGSSQEDLSGGGMFINNNRNNNNNQFVSTAEGGADIGNSDDGVINIQQRADGILDLENDVKDRVSYENSQTIDLLQLSSQLPRVEHHRQSVLVKEENPAFCFVQIT